MTPAEGLTLIKETAELCAQLADAATCPREGASRIRERFRLPRSPAVDTGPGPRRFPCHGCGGLTTTYGVALCPACLQLGRAPLTSTSTTPEYPCHRCGQRTAPYGHAICQACRLVRVAQR